MSFILFDVFFFFVFFFVGEQETLAKAKARSKARKTEKTEVFDPAAELGVTEPLGFFDPMEFCRDVDKVKFRQLRTSELKHGRALHSSEVNLSFKLLLGRYRHVGVGGSLGPAGSLQKESK